MARSDEEILKRLEDFYHNARDYDNRMSRRAFKLWQLYRDGYETVIHIAPFPDACEVCKQHHNKEYTIEEIAFSDYLMTHPNCRCTYIGARKRTEKKEGVPVKGGGWVKKKTEPKIAKEIWLEVDGEVIPLTKFKPTKTKIENSEIYVFCPLCGEKISLKSNPEYFDAYMHDTFSFLDLVKRTLIDHVRDKHTNYDFEMWWSRFNDVINPIARAYEDEARMLLGWKFPGDVYEWIAKKFINWVGWDERDIIAVNELAENTYVITMRDNSHIYIGDDPVKVAFFSGVDVKEVKKFRPRYDWKWPYFVVIRNISRAEGGVNAER
jgi:hypothetical protein